MLEQFAYVTAHDFQEPMRNVAVFSELLARRWHGTLDKESEELLGYVLSGAKRMHTMARGLLEWVRAVEDSAEVEATADSGTILRQAMENYHAEIERAKAEVSIGTLPVVCMREQHLLRIWTHLLDNALTYRGDEAPRIGVAADRIPCGWQFSMKDNGIGIPVAFQGRVFGVFKRLNSA